MQNVFIETTKGWGKFMVARFDSELQHQSTMLRPDAPYPNTVVAARLGSLDIIVFDLTTREGRLPVHLSVDVNITLIIQSLSRGYSGAPKRLPLLP